jgi:Bax protein
LIAIAINSTSLSAAGDAFDALASQDIAETNSGGVVRSRLISAKSTAEILHQFAALKVSLSDIRRGASDVPPLFLTRFPADLRHLKSTAVKKTAFIQTVLPLILQANSEVAQQRRQMNDILHDLENRRPVSADRRLFLARLANDYGVEDGDWAELRRRVDEIPVSLALAQGAEESGWGTSRFAHQGNAVFGQRTFRRGRGIVPQRREAGKKFEVLRFGALLTSVRAYVWNLNTHPAYAGFRKARAESHRAGRTPSGMEMIASMLRYSERGQAYVDTIRAIIRGNRLWQFDGARLAGPDQSA